jgi:hypothetical protein
MFEGIYDEAPKGVEDAFGFVTPSTAVEAGTLVVDASSYTNWVYVNFHNMKVETRDVNEEAPASWDIALHRYDAKTNGGAAVETTYSDFQALAADGLTGYVADTWTTEQIAIDMSTMMDGYLTYTESDYNEELSKWLDVDTSNMPPTYTLSNKIYVVQLEDGTRAALKLDNYMDAAGIKGVLTIRYIYPL